MGTKRPGRDRAGRLALLLSAGVLAMALTVTGRPATGTRTAAVIASQVGCANLPATALDHNVPWAQRTLGFQRVWPITQGAGVTVAVVDTGIDEQQPFLRGGLLRGVSVIGGSAGSACGWHATFVAGLIAGRQLPGFGFAGVAPQATILPVKQADAAGSGTARALAAGIVAAVRHHAQVINVSIVTATPSFALAQAVRYALAHNVVIVAAAGNDFAAGNAVQYPAGFPGVLAVGAVDASGQRASFSESGPDVSVVAPGTDLLGPGAGGVGLIRSGGTSFATAYVSGVAALVRSYYPDLTAPEVIRRIEATADHPPGTLPTPGLGWGVVDPYAAVTAVLPARSAAGRTAPARISLRPSGPTGQQGHAAAAAAAAFGLVVALAVLLSGGVLRRGRRRNWRPGT